MRPARDLPPLVRALLALPIALAARAALWLYLHPTWAAVIEGVLLLAIGLGLAALVFGALARCDALPSTIAGAA